MPSVMAFVDVVSNSLFCDGFLGCQLRVAETKLLGILPQLIGTGKPCLGWKRTGFQRCSGLDAVENALGSNNLSRSDISDLNLVRAACGDVQTQKLSWFLLFGGRLLSAFQQRFHCVKIIVDLFLIVRIMKLLKRS